MTSHRPSITRFGANNSFILRSEIQLTRFAGSPLMSLGHASNVLPQTSAERISCADTSKLTAANWATAVPCPPWIASLLHEMRLLNDPWAIAIPLGVPVEPEV